MKAWMNELGMHSQRMRSEVLQQERGKLVNNKDCLPISNTDTNCVVRKKKKGERNRDSISMIHASFREKWQGKSILDFARFAVCTRDSLLFSHLSETAQIPSIFTWALFSLLNHLLKLVCKKRRNFVSLYFKTTKSGVESKTLLNEMDWYIVN